MGYLLGVVYFAVIVAIAVTLRRRREPRWLYWSIFALLFGPLAFLAWINRADPALRDDQT
jgi:uncharacterized membrane protein YoaK (UPF0700 family)